MAEEKEPEVMSAADLQRKVQAGEDPSAGAEDAVTEEAASEDVTVTGEDMMDTEKTDEKEGDANGAECEPDGTDGTDKEDTADGDASGEPGDGGKESKGKRKKKKEKKDPRDEKIAELNDRLLRNLAEFENFRNRSEKEKEARFDMGARSVVEKILPVVDNLERGLDGLTDEEKESPFAKGIEAVYKQLMTAFTEMGVAPIEAVGQEFNPDFHQAVMHEEDDSDEINIVTEELQKGYTYKDTVVRYSMVKVKN